MSNIKLKNVRLSFPFLFRKAVHKGKETKYESTFLLDKKEHADAIKAINAEIAAMLLEHKPNPKLTSDKICFKDGDDGREEYAGCMVFKASNNSRPMVINKDKSPITQDDNIIYSGCYVNCIVSLWYQNNDFGKRINGSLSAVQFAKDGEPFVDGGSKASVDDFDVIDDDNDSF